MAVLAFDAARPWCASSTRTPKLASRSATWAEISGATARASSRSCASTTVTRRPPAASVAAISRPMKPPPRMTTSSTCAGKFADGAGVGDRAQRQHAGERAAFDRQHARARAGGEDGLVEGDAAARGELQALCRRVEAFDAFAEQKVDRLAGIEGFGAQDLRLGGGILDEGLRQRRLVVGQLGLVADQHDAAVIAFLAQARGGLHASVSRSDDDDTVVHDSSCACLAPLRRREMSASGALGRVRVASGMAACQGAHVGQKHD